MKGSRIVLAVAAAAVMALPGGTALAGTGPARPAAKTTHVTAAHVTATMEKLSTTKAARTQASTKGPAAKRGSWAGWHRTVIVNCLRRGEVRPHSYMIACGDGSEYVSKLRWSSWNPSEATATGQFSLNNCTPNCARGKYTHSDVLVVLWHARAWPHHARQAFGRMTVIYTGKRPAHSAQSFTQTLWYPVR